MPMLLFEHLNLKRNPFETPTPEDWAKLAIPVAGFTPQTLAEWVSVPGRAVLCLGECGRGKSTHAHAIRKHLARAPWVYVGPGERPELPQAAVLFVDEAQRLGWLRRRGLWRRGTSFVVTSHVDHTGEMQRAGLEVETFRVGGLKTDTLRTIVDTRIEWARRGAGDLPRVTDAALSRLLDDFGDDLRAILSVLYDVFQKLERVEDVELADESYRELAEQQPRSRHRK
jgi:hypothetical protein